MDNDRPTLREIAQRASDRNGGVRGRALDRVAKKAGLTLSYTTVDRILAGTYTATPSRKTLKALAALAGVDESVAFEAAGLPISMGSLAELLPPDADLLDGPQRDAVVAVVRQFVAAQKALHNPKELMGNAEHPPATKPPEPGPADQPGEPRILREVSPFEVDVAARKDPKTSDRSADPDVGGES